MTINEIAQMTGLSAYTLRYYEKIGLIMNIARKSSGCRSYSEADLAWIEFLLRLKETGMPLSEMQKFAMLRSMGDNTAPERLELLKKHRNRVDHKFMELKSNIERLSEKIRFYEKLSETEKKS